MTMQDVINEVIEDRRRIEYDEAEIARLGAELEELDPFDPYFEVEYDSLSNMILDLQEDLYQATAGYREVLI